MQEHEYDNVADDLRYKLSKRRRGETRETKQLEEFPWIEDKL